MCKNTSVRLSKILMGINLFLYLLIGNSFATEDSSNWKDRPVKVNVQVNLQREDDQAYIDKILTEIEKHGRTTIFVTGEFASKYPEVIKKIEARGHQIAVYGWQKGEDISKLKAEKLTETKKEELKKKVRLKTIEGENDCWGKFYETK